LFGLCNNYGYVIMLSAAEDIMDIQKGENITKTTSDCEDRITSRHCTTISTGAVLLADNLPTLFVKLTFPFFMHRIPFVFRHVLICLLQATSYFVVAFSQNIPMSLAGVCFASLGSGIGEISYLALASHYPALAIAAWSSGTGGAGLIGSFSYAFLTERTMGNLQPKDALLIQLFIPVVFALAYFFILVTPDDVYTPGLHPKTWIVPRQTTLEVYSLHLNMTTNQLPSSWLPSLLILPFQPLLHLMIPLALVYVGEYLINQGVTQLIIFNCSEGFHLTLNAQYRWYQVLYQLGVFISRSSVRLFELPTWSLFLLPVLQASNFVFFLFEAIYWFTPHIAIIFGLIIFEGLLGGAAYVNTFNKIHKMVPPDIREYSLSVASVGDSMGVNFAGFMSIPLHNFVCRQPMHRH
uniref:Battenin n=1 Tax=Haemonchus placei TaxID=6290 RepID=A0A158QRN3_HAEPC